VLHLLRPRVTPGALLIEIMSKSGASFIETTSENLVSLVVSIDEAPALTHNLNQ
jgi:hypothetical protein